MTILSTLLGMYPIIVPYDSNAGPMSPETAITYKSIIYGIIAVYLIVLAIRFYIFGKQLFEFNDDTALTGVVFPFFDIIAVITLFVYACYWIGKFIIIYLL